MKVNSLSAGLAPVESAKAAGLRYVTDTMPGYRRLRAGKGFRYVDANGRTVHDPDTLHRVKAQAIPPAWTDVWICPLPHGHLQATGRDAKGRKQFRYHARWREVRDATKFDRLIAFGQTLPRLRARVRKHLALPGLPREKVLAAIVRLLETTLIRIGNEEYARQNGSVGLTTMRNHHVDVSGSSLCFEFRGKSGIKHRVGIQDRRLARIVKSCQELPGQELFQYVDEEGGLRPVGSADVNDYLREVTGQEFTAKDFRTWAGTLLAASAFREFAAAASQTKAKRNLGQAIESVAKRLGNTKAICRKCYIHPALTEAFLAGRLPENGEQREETPADSSTTRLQPQETAVLAFLQQDSNGRHCLTDGKAGRLIVSLSPEEPYT